MKLPKMWIPAGSNNVFLSGTVLMIHISVAASSAASSNDTGGLWPSSFDFSFASKPEPSTCKSTDMCGTMPGICKHGDCRTTPCTNAIICDCHAGWEGVYCETKISTADQSQGTSPTNEPGKTLVNGNVDKSLMSGKAGSENSGKSIDNGIRTTVTDKTNGNGIDNGATSTDGKKLVDNGITDNGKTDNGVPVTAATDKIVVTSAKPTTVTDASTTTSHQKLDSVTVNSSTQGLTTTETVTTTTTTVTHLKKPESVGEQINQKLQNGEIKPENVLDVLIASVKENDALAKNKSASTKQDPLVTTTRAADSKETTVSKPVTTTDKTASKESTTTSRTTIHPDGSFRKGPESTYVSDNSPVNLEPANKTIKHSANEIPVKNTTDTVTIPSTVLSLTGISVPPTKNCTGNCSKEQSNGAKSDAHNKNVANNLNVQTTTSSAKPSLIDSNEMKLEKIVESIIIHKPKESVINKSKGTVNLQRSTIDKSVKETHGKVPPNGKSASTGQNSTSALQPTKQNIESTKQTTPMSITTGKTPISTLANTKEPTPR